MLTSQLVLISTAQLGARDGGGCGDVGKMKLNRDISSWPAREGESLLSGYRVKELHSWGRYAASYYTYHHGSRKRIPANPREVENVNLWNLKVEPVTWECLRLLISGGILSYWILHRSRGSSEGCLSLRLRVPLADLLKKPRKIWAIFRIAWSLRE